MISKKTVECSMRRQDLVARPKKRRRGLTKADKGKRLAPDLLGRDFTADRPNQKWCGDFKQIDTDEGPIFLGSCLDLFADGCWVSLSPTTIPPPIWPQRPSTWRWQYGAGT